jgi:pyruvate,water dikinase
MVSGVHVAVFEPDDRLKELARRAIDTGLAATVVQHHGDAAALWAALDASEAGRSWHEAFDSAGDPWFNFSHGNGFYHHHGSWVDDLTFPLSMIAEYIGRLQEGQDLSRPLGELSTERDVIVARYRDLIVDDAGRQAFDEGLGLSRTVFPYVENHNFFVEHWYMTVFWNKMRELGALLAGRGFFDRPDDIFFLRRSELHETIVDLQFSWSSGGEAIGPDHWPPIIASRRHILDVLRDWTPPPALGPAPDAIVEPMTIMLWGITDSQVQRWLDAQSEDVRARKILEGFAGSPGVVEGRARVIKKVEDLPTLQQGEILVAPITSTSWTPVFKRISAAVSDIGGIMCHAAIVSREYGLPAVVGTGTATATIATGDLVLVDGDSGTVTILERA